MPSPVVTTTSLIHAWSRTTIVGTIGRGRAFSGLLAVTVAMPEFKPGDRVRTVECGFAGHVIGTFAGSLPGDPWPLVRITHALEYPTMVGADCTWSPNDLEHID